MTDKNEVSPREALRRLLEANPNLKLSMDDLSPTDQELHEGALEGCYAGEYGDGGADDPV